MPDFQHESQSSVATDGGDQCKNASVRLKLDLTGLQHVFILSTYLSTSELHVAEDEISTRGAVLTYDIREANIVLGNISKQRRAKFELQCGKVRFEEIHGEKRKINLNSSFDTMDETSARKRRELPYGDSKTLIEHAEDDTDDLTTGSETENTTEDEGSSAAKPMSQLSISQVSLSPAVGSPDTFDGDEPAPPQQFTPGDFAGIVKVLRLDWLKDSIAAGRPEPFELYTLFEARLLPPLEIGTSPQRVPRPKDTGISAIAVTDTLKPPKDASREILERAKAEPNPYVAKAYRRDRIKDAANRDFMGRSFASSSNIASQSFSQTDPPHLLHQTTSEHDEAITNTVPTMPDWVLQHKIYSCERSTPFQSPNDLFIGHLKRIRLARTLAADGIGIRAYSTSIASLAAYPYPLTSSREVLMLPGCDQKIATLFHEYQTTGSLQAVKDFEADPVMRVLRIFYDVWGVGALTAREFYYDRNWRDLDNIIEEGWKSISRVQQIGVKYYDEFQLRIPRPESEHIASIVKAHANRCLLSPDQNISGIETILVGGYRRGQPDSGDVDIILSHRDERQTSGLVDRVVRSLEKEGWITHTLTLNLTHTTRHQQPLPLASFNNGGHSFDTLDKALVVWQNLQIPLDPTNASTKNPNPHRRVDIIVSPWRTIGCAVQGWTSGTTFNRDIRRYAKKVKGWKYDSSGVRERGTGVWVDLEGWRNERTRCHSVEEAEKRVFAGLGLEWRAPEERCTG